MHLTIRLKSLGIKCSTLSTSQTSSTSYSSVKNKVSLMQLAKGQYLSNPSKRGMARVLSLVKNNIEHLNSCSQNCEQVCTLWRGIITFLKKITCSSLRGTAKPEIIEAKISKSSAAPLNLWVSWIKEQKHSLIAFLIIFLLGTSYTIGIRHTHIILMKIFNQIQSTKTISRFLSELNKLINMSIMTYFGV